MEGEIGFKDCFPNVYGCDPSGIIAEIEMELSVLVKRQVLNEKPTTVYITERRGVNLYHPFLDAIILNGHTIGTVRNNHSAQMMELNCPKTNHQKPVIILTDAIRRGIEISAILKKLKDDDIRVSKVCCYLVDINIIKELRENYADISFDYIHGASDYKEYTQYSEKLIPVHHSRIVPLGSDHPYNVYKCITTLNKGEVECILRQICEGYSDFHEDERLCSENMLGFTAEFSDYSSFENISPSLNDNIIDFERIILRFRYDTSKNSLRVMAFCSVLINDINDVEAFNCNENGFLFSLPNPYFYCKDMSDRIVEIHCTNCIDTNISQEILNSMEKKIYEVSSRKGYKFENISEYNPFLSQRKYICGSFEED